MNELRLVHPLFSKPIDFEEDCVNILIFEDGRVFAKFIHEMDTQITSNDGEFVFSQGYKPLPLAKNMEIITDFFNIDKNERRIVGKIFDELQLFALNEDNYLKTCQLKNALNAYFLPLLCDFSYNLSYDDEIDLIQLFKAMKLHLMGECTNLLEVILEYLSILRNILKIKCVCFVNLKSFLSDEELKYFYEDVMYNKYTVLLLENQTRKHIEPFEKICIFDKDLCEIRINS